jgi:integrase
MSILVRGTKGSNSRVFPLTEDFYYRILDEIKDHEDPHKPVFQIKYNRLGDIWRTYRPTKKKLHSLRHTCAIALFKKTNNHRLVQKVLGHKNLSTTEIYLDFQITQDEFRAVLC